MPRPKKLEDYLPKSERKKKTVYTMVRFDKRIDLLEFVESRTKKLGTTKNAYLLALIEQDKAVSDDKKD